MSGQSQRALLVKRNGSIAGVRIQREGLLVGHDGIVASNNLDEHCRISRYKEASNIRVDYLKREAAVRDTILRKLSVNLRKLLQPSR